MKLLDFLRRRRRRKRETPLSIEEMSESEKNVRFGDLALMDAELKHSMDLRAFELDRKRRKQTKSIYW